jgi:hypothetical protein
VSVLWPRLTRTIARAEFERIRRDGGKNGVSHPAQIYSAVGGRHAAESEVASLAQDLLEVAHTFGYPERASDADRIRFDRAAARILHDKMDLSWSEGAARDLWSFTAIVVLPELTQWRFGVRNEERWVGSDLTRHAWGRLWWQWVTFADAPELLEALTESDLNQLLERRSIGGDVRLVCALSRGLIERVPTADGRRAVIREVTAQMRRRLAFIDVRSLGDSQLQALVSSLVDTAMDAIDERTAG